MKGVQYSKLIHSFKRKLDDQKIKWTSTENPYTLLTDEQSQGKLMIQNKEVDIIRKIWISAHLRGCQAGVAICCAGAAHSCVQSAVHKEPKIALLVIKHPPVQ